jgi:ethanolamine utilization protein EutN
VFRARRGKYCAGLACSFRWARAPIGAAGSAALPNKIMFLAKVEGSVVSTKKEASMNGRKLLILRPQLVDEKDPTKFRPGSNTIVAVDSVGAGIGELVMFCQGSSARLAAGLKDAPVDAVVIGIVDVVDVLGKQIYSAKS